MFTRNKEVLKRQPTISEKRIKIVSQMKYLGVTLNCKMDWYPHTHYKETRFCTSETALPAAQQPHGAWYSTTCWPFINTPYFQSSHTPQRLGIRECAKELKVICSKFKEPPSFLYRRHKISFKPSSINNFSDNAYWKSYATIQILRSNL